MKLRWPDPSTIPGLSDHQREQLTRAFAGPVGVFSGKPGTGKTFTAAAAIKAIVAEYGSWGVAVAAPTGKAAVRIMASLQSYGLPLGASTIHRLLGVNRTGYDGKGWGFEYNAENNLPHRFIFIDEVSMLDTDLAASLLSAVAPGTHILFIGDPYQLPPVGHGAPLRDWIAAGLPYGELTEIRRNGGDIVRVCDEIARGRPFKPSQYVDLETGRNVLHLESHRPAISIEYLKRLLLTLPAGFDPVWDVQVLTAVNDKSELGRVKLNKLMQDWLNPHGERSKGNPFRKGDKVICTTNTLLDLVPNHGDGSRPAPNSWEYRDDPENPGGRREFVANGEMGKVVHVEEKLFHVRFDFPARTVKVPLSGKKLEAKGDDEHAGAACDFQLGFACSDHKSQGSQWKIVIQMIDDYPGARHVCCRELYTTGLSRGETLTATIGKASILDQDCRKVALVGRKTFLKELIVAGGMQGGAA